MALYLGSDGRRKIILNNAIYCLNLVSQTSIINYIRLLSSDNYILTDSTGMFLIPKDSTPSVQDNTMVLSLDGYVLTDINGLYLTAKESE